MAEGADQEPAFGGARFENQAVSSHDALLVMGIPEHQQRRQRVELGNIGYDLAGEVKMLQLEQQFAGHLQPGGRLRYVRRTAEEPMGSQRKAVGLAIGEEQEFAACFD